MNLIESTLPTPVLYIRNNVADTGAEPDVMTMRAREPPTRVRQTADNMDVGDSILGSSPGVVYVSRLYI